MASLVAALGCANAHDPALIDAGEVAGSADEAEETDAAVAGEEADAEPMPEPAPGPDRARESASHSFCDRSTATLGIYFEDLYECFSAPGGPKTCYGADAFETILVLDARARTIIGSLSVEVLSEDALYGEGALAQLEGIHACSDLRELVMIAVSRADTRLDARVFDGRQLGGVSGFDLSTGDCVGTFHDFGGYGDRVELFALARGDAPLRGPEQRALGGEDSMTDVTVQLVDDCAQLLGYLAVWYRGHELTVVAAY